MKLFDLERAEKILSAPDPEVPPAGPMVPHLGPKLSHQEVAAAYDRRFDGLQEATPALLRSIRSFPVVRLQGQVLECKPEEFDDLVPGLFANRLGIGPGPFVGRHSDGHGLLDKYHILDGAYVAPPDDATGQTMVIELGGTVSGPHGSLARGSSFPGTVVVTITTAHWSNVSGLGIGVGFYM